MENQESLLERLARDNNMTLIQSIERYGFFICRGNILESPVKSE